MPILGKNVRQRTRKRWDIKIDSMIKGVNTLFSDTRLDKEEAKEASNMWLVEDGVLDKRPGTEAYGSVTYTNRPDGASEYIKSDGTRELIVVADGKVYKQTTSTKTEISGATFTQGTRCYFIQFNEFLYIANGVDSLARYGGSSLSTYSGLSTPSWDGTPLTRGAGLSSGSYTYYYQVTAVNDVGETTPAAEKSIAVDKDRGSWDATANEHISLAWADVTGADKYVVYFTDTSGFEVKLAETTVSEYKDDGTAVPNPYIEPPTDDTTTGPKFGPMTISGNRIWATGDPDNPYRVYFSGVGVNKGNFSPAYGGGWVDLEKGGRDQVVAIKDFQGVAHIWMKTPDGHGSIWQVKLDTVEISGTSFTVPIPTKIISSIGSNAARSIVYVENDIFFFNKRGVFVLGNEPGVLDVLRTNELSANIRPYIEGLDGDSIDKVAAYYYQSRVYFAVSNASGEPDRIIVFDRERGAWLKDWTVGVSQFLEFTDSSGTTHFLGISSNKLIEFSTSYQSDEGTAFTWRYKSPRIPIQKDWSRFGRLLRAYVRLRNATGNISVSVSGTGKQSQLSNVSSATITPGSSNSGIGWDPIGSVAIGDTDGTPTFFASESLIRYLRLNPSQNIVRDIQWEISGDSVGDKAVITGVMAEGVETDQKLPLSSKL